MSDQSGPACNAAGCVRPRPTERGKMRRGYDARQLLRCATLLLAARRGASAVEHLFLRIVPDFIPVE